ncbi:hypothetical protein EVA_19285 [gut metagenome]|uniref:Uncharacterized protein n=1 Tax=gut metagenome TaxID=749906 RepID=J9FZ56_9ZZZZ
MARCALRRGHSGKLAGANVLTLDWDLSLRLRFSAVALHGLG